MPETMLINALHAVRRRVRLLGILHGLGVVIASTVGLLLAVVLLDYFLDLPSFVRIAFVLASLIVVGYLLSQRVVRAALAKLGLSDVAGKLETHFPEFNDRLRSTVDFLTRGTPGSEVMKDRTVSQAAEMVRRVDLNEAIDKHPTVHSLLGAFGSIVVVLLLAWAVGREYMSPALSRLFNPFSVAVWPKSVIIAEDRLPRSVPVGGHVNVKVHLLKGDKASREVYVYYQYGNGRVEKEIMNRAGGRTFTASLDARGAAMGGNGLMSVWVESGDDTTPKSHINVLQRLAIQSVEMVVTPPPYTGIPAQPGVELAGNPRSVTYGSTLDLHVKFNKDLDTSKPIAVVAATGDSKTPELKWDPLGGAVAVAHFMARRNVAFQLKATDTDGFTNTDLATMSVIVKLDEKPTVTITQPVGENDCTPVAEIPIVISAGDDIQVSSVKLIAARLGEKPQEFPAIDLVANGKPIDAAGVTWKLQDNVDKPMWTIFCTLDMSKLDTKPLNPGDKIDIRAQVKDNFDFEGQTHEPVDSNHIRFNILSQEQFTQKMADLMAAIRERVVEARNREKSLADRTSFLRNDSTKRQEFNPGDRDQANQLVSDQNDNAGKTTDLAKQLGDMVKLLEQNKSTAADLKDIAANVGKDLQHVAEQPMKDASADINAARDRKAPSPTAPDAQKQQNTDARNSQLDNAVGNQNDSADKLDQAANRMGSVSSLSRAIEQLKEIQKQQHDLTQKSDEVGLKNLGKTPEQMNPADRKQQQDTAAQQSKLGDKTDKAIGQLGDNANKMQKKDPAAASAMKNAAQIGRQQGVASQMKSASQQMQQNQQSNTQQSQSQVEVGLQMMIRELEEAQNRKLEELIKQLADVKHQLEDLVRQQAALNISNLTLRGEDLHKILSDRLNIVLDEATYTIDHLPVPPDLATQTNLQEQTRHNTQSVAKMVEALPEGAAGVTQLDRAADLMGRAIVSLRDDAGDQKQKLSAAYDPPQLEALAALEKVRDLVAAQLQKAQDQQNAAKKDAIRKQFEALLARQKKLDGDTVAIDKAPHPDNQWGRIDGARLAQLPGEQDAIAQDTGKMDASINALGGIVYTWANKDIVDSMNLVKKDLARPDPGAATQAEQVRIEEQLQAMIDSLKVDPKTSEFASKSSGGGGRGGAKGSPRLPSEAELRLMKRLQEAVNKSTETLAKLDKLDEQKVVALGGRQGKLKDLLGQLLDKATQGKLKLPPDLDPAEKLPEEAAKDDQADLELQTQLLQAGSDPTVEQETSGIKMVGQRMARARDRLAHDKDAGPVTQDIQKHVVKNLDELIEMARQQQKQGKPGQGDSGDPQPGKPEDSQGSGKQPDNSQSNGQQQKGNASTGATPGEGNRDTDASGASHADIAQTLKEWGQLSPRKRAAIDEVPGEHPLDKFKDLVDQYYRAVGVRLNNNGNQ